MHFFWCDARRRVKRLCPGLVAKIGRSAKGAGYMRISALNDAGPGDAKAEAPEVTEHCLLELEAWGVGWVLRNKFRAPLLLLKHRLPALHHHRI